MVFIDLRTACDNINRRRLYEKLAQHGISQENLRLEGRSMSDDGTSEDTGVTSEVFELRSG